MKNKIQNYLVAVFLLFGLTAFAGQQLQTPYNGGTNNFGTNSVTVIQAYPIAVNLSKDWCLGLAFATSATAVAAVNTLTLDTSCDAVHWQTNAVTILTTNLITTGATNQAFAVSVQSLGIPFYRLGIFTQTNNTQYYTNVVINAFTKDNL